jgi:hypothetical protein
MQETSDKSKIILLNRNHQIAANTEQPISLCDVKNKNYEMRYRHINQILIRGDNIVMVSYAD